MSRYFARNIPCAGYSEPRLRPWPVGHCRSQLERGLATECLAASLHPPSFYARPEYPRRGMSCSRGRRTLPE